MSSDRLETLQARVEALEVKASYSEDLLETLNLTIYRQQQAIDLLVQELGKPAHATCAMSCRLIIDSCRRF